MAIFSFLIIVASGEVFNEALPVKLSRGAWMIRYLTAPIFFITEAPLGNSTLRCTVYIAIQLYHYGLNNSALLVSADTSECGQRQIEYRFQCDCNSPCIRELDVTIDIQ